MRKSLGQDPDHLACGAPPCANLCGLQVRVYGDQCFKVPTEFQVLKGRDCGLCRPGVTWHL